MNDAATKGAALVLLGAGGHARSLLGLLTARGLCAAGCIAPTAPAEVWPKDCPWLGDDAALDALDSDRVALVNGVGSVGSTALRRKVFDAARARGFTFPAVVHPSVIRAEDVTLADGAQVLAGAILQAGVTVGENALLNTGCIVDHECQIGAHAHLAPGVTLSGGVTIGSSVHVGTSAVVIQGICIGNGAIVGAGAVVTKDVAPGVTVVGNPARPLDRALQKRVISR
ncbi:acetyltransferase [Sulfitobacter pontiacus]|uniref:acetyltransferase n=1 Tax=Sulfitobacter pontiacus TaxID=60137 RepID=UPI0014048B5B|nr:acetyltransferase [Sulfitobacter pontiacus]GLO80043.1 pilus assembly protein [Sulfitobacter pontiacus]